MYILMYILGLTHAFMFPILNFIKSLDDTERKIVVRGTVLAILFSLAYLLFVPRLTFGVFGVIAYAGIPPMFSLVAGLVANAFKGLCTTYRRVCQLSFFTVILFMIIILSVGWLDLIFGALLVPVCALSAWFGSWAGYKLSSHPSEESIILDKE